MSDHDQPTNTSENQPTEEQIDALLDEFTALPLEDVDAEAEFIAAHPEIADRLEPIRQAREERRGGAAPDGDGQNDTHSAEAPTTNDAGSEADTTDTEPSADAGDDADASGDTSDESETPTELTEEQIDALIDQFMDIPLENTDGEEIFIAEHPEIEEQLRQLQANRQSRREQGLESTPPRDEEPAAEPVDEDAAMEAQLRQEEEEALRRAEAGEGDGADGGGEGGEAGAAPADAAAQRQADRDARRDALRQEAQGAADIERMRQILVELDQLRDEEMADLRAQLQAAIAAAPAAGAAAAGAAATPPPAPAAPARRAQPWDNPHDDYDGYLNLPRDASDERFHPQLDRSRPDALSYVADTILDRTIPNSEIPDYVTRSMTRVLNVLDMLRRHRAGQSGTDILRQGNSDFWTDNGNDLFNTELERFKNALHNFLYEYKKALLVREYGEGNVPPERLHEEANKIVTNIIFRAAWHLEDKRDEYLNLDQPPAATPQPGRPGTPEQRRERNIILRFMDWYGKKPWWQKGLMVAGVATGFLFMTGAAPVAALTWGVYRGVRAVIGGAIAGAAAPLIHRAVESHHAGERRRLEREAIERIRAASNATNHENKADVRRLMVIVDDEARRLSEDLRRLGVREKWSKLAGLLAGSALVAWGAGQAIDAATNYGEWPFGKPQIAGVPEAPEKPAGPPIDTGSDTAVADNAAALLERGKLIGEPYTLKAGDNLWKVMTERFPGVSENTLREAWNHSQVKIDGEYHPISRVWLVHPGDKMALVSTDVGPRFVVVDAKDGLPMGDVNRYHGILVDKGTQPGSALEKAYHGGTVVDHFPDKAAASAATGAGTETAATAAQSGTTTVEAAAGVAGAETGGKPIDYRSILVTKSTWGMPDLAASDLVEGKGIRFFGFTQQQPQMTIADLENLVKHNNADIPPEKTHMIPVFMQNEQEFTKLHETVQSEIKARHPNGIPDKNVTVLKFSEQP